MLRIVIDTNVLIAALIRKNTPPYQLYKYWKEGVFELVTSQAQLAEIERVMAYPKLQRYFSQEEAKEMLMGLSIYGTFYVDLPHITASPDPDDNLILATAIVGQANYIVSGDKGDMLALGEVEGIPIITVRNAVELLERTAP